MDELFYWLFNMSIVASLTGLVVILIRIIKKIPRRVIIFLWIIPLLGFWFPFGIGGKYNLMSLLSHITTKTIVVSQNKGTEFSTTNSLMLASSYFPISYKTHLLYDIFKYASIVWVSIAASIILFVAIIYIKTIVELKNANHFESNIYYYNKAITPAVYGIIHPHIILPSTMKDEDGLNLIILHENQHIRRGDNLWRIVAFITVAIHWFNPLAWLFLKLFLSDIELACDESVLSKLSNDKRSEYALKLLNVHKKKAIVASSFGGAKIKTRIEHIISYKRMTALSTIGFGILVVIIAYVLLTNAM